MTILLVTHSEDHHGVEGVAAALRERGEEPVRVDTDLFPTEVRLAASYGAGGGRHVLYTPAAEVPLAEVTAIWNRRFAIGRAIPTELDPQVRSASVQESRDSLRGLLAGLEVYALDPLDRVARAKNKQLQLRLAAAAGLEVPDTLVTNDPAAVRAFAAAHPAGVVCKMMTSFAVHDDHGRESVVFTNLLSEGDLEDLDGLALSPMTFQQAIPKALELRVTVVGRRVFAAAIDSQASARATHDWRRDGAALVDRWDEYRLPAEIEQRLLTVCDRLGLDYGAADLILTPDGRHVFLEVNPAGEWFWLERTPGFPLSRAIAEVLAEPEARRAG